MGTIKNTVKQSMFAFDADDQRLVVVTDPKSKYYDERNEIKPSAEFVQSIIDRGVIQNITVKKNGDEYIVIAGNKRVMGARVAQQILRDRGEDRIIRVPAKPTNVNDYECLATKVVENEHRVDDSPYYKGQKAQQMKDALASNEEIEKAFGAKWATIAGWITIYHSGEDVGNAVTSGEITTTQALEVARSPEEMKAAVLDKVKKVGRRKAGRKAGKNVRRIVFTCYEKDGEGFDISVKGKVSTVDLESIIIELEKKLNSAVDDGEVEV